MRVQGQLTYAQLENLTSAPAGVPLGRIYMDVTSVLAGIPYVYDGTAWCRIIAQTAGAKVTIPTLLYTAAGRQSNLVIKTSSGAYACLSTDEVVIINKTVAATTAVTLPTSPETGRRVTIKDGKGDGNSFNITVAAAVGNIDGAATSVISTAYGVKNYVYNGTQWNVT